MFDCYVLSFWKKSRSDSIKDTIRFNYVVELFLSLLILCLTSHSVIPKDMQDFMVPKWFFFTMAKLQLFDSCSLRAFEKNFSIHFDHLL